MQQKSALIGLVSWLRSYTSRSRFICAQAAPVSRRQQQLPYKPCCSIDPQDYTQSTRSMEGCITYSASLSIEIFAAPFVIATVRI